MRDQARRCTAKSKRSGERCRQNCLLKPDGTYTKNCAFHKGGAELLERGDPALGGRPPTTFLHTQLLRPRLTAEQQATFDQASESSPVDRMQALVAFAYTQLDAYLAKYGLAVEGGQVVSSASGTVESEAFELHARIIHGHIDAIRKAEKDLLSLRESDASRGGDGDGTQDYASWLAGVRSSKPSKRRR